MTGQPIDERYDVLHERTPRRRRGLAFVAPVALSLVVAACGTTADDTTTNAGSTSSTHSASSPGTASTATSSAPPVASTPTWPPAPSSLPWVASAVATATTPAGVAVWVSTHADGTEVPVDGVVEAPLLKVDVAENATARVVGWYGVDRRTLVWAAGQDATTLRAASFTATGEIASPARDLLIPGLIGTGGWAFPLGEDAGFAWVRMTRSAPTWEVSYVDATLHVVATYPMSLPASGTPEVASADAVGVRTSPSRMAVWQRRGAVVDVELPAQCASSRSGTPPTVGSDGTVRLRCGDRLASYRTGTTSPLVAASSPVVPGGQEIVAQWFDRDGTVLLSTSGGSGAGGVATWRLQGSAWVQDAVQDVVVRVAAGAVDLALHARGPGGGGDPGTGAWVSETTPSVQVAPVVPPASPESLVLAVRATA